MNTNITTVGVHARRLDNNPVEAAFSVEWKERVESSKPVPMLAYLVGENFTQRDSTVAATIVQWLGTPVGVSFLAGALGRIPPFERGHFLVSVLDGNVKSIPLDMKNRLLKLLTQEG